MAFAAIAGLVTALGSAAYGVGSGMASRKKTRRQQDEYARNIEAALENRETSREGNADAMRMAQNAAKAAKYLRGQMAVGGGSTEKAAAGVESIGNSVAKEAAAETQIIRNDIRSDSNIRVGLQKEINAENRQDEAARRANISNAVNAAGNIASQIAGMHVDSPDAETTETETKAPAFETTPEEPKKDMPTWDYKTGWSGFGQGNLKTEVTSTDESHAGEPGWEYDLSTGTYRKINS